MFQVFFAKRSIFDFMVPLASPSSVLECHADLHMTVFVLLTELVGSAKASQRVYPLFYL